MPRSGFAFFPSRALTPDCVRWPSMGYGSPSGQTGLEARTMGIYSILENSYGIDHWGSVKTSGGGGAEAQGTFQGPVTNKSTI